MRGRLAGGYFLVKDLKEGVRFQKSALHDPKNNFLRMQISLHEWFA